MSTVDPKSLPLSSPIPFISSLPDDILLLIISFVNVKDILTLRQTSRRLYSMSKLRWVWTNAMKQHVIDRGLPVPAANLDFKAFSSEHLEARAVHAAKFHENWYSSQPRPRSTIEFQADKPPPSTSDDLAGELQMLKKPVVQQVGFLPGRNGEFLVCVVGKTITCWEVPLDGSGAYRVAEWESFGPIEQFVVNDDPKYEAQLAFTATVRDGACVQTLALDTFHGVFMGKALIQAPRHLSTPLYGMHGKHVFMGEVPFSWDTTDLSRGGGLKPFYTELEDHDHSKVITVKIIGRYMLIVRIRSLLLCEREPGCGTTELASARLHLDVPVTEAVVVTQPPATNAEGLCDWPTGSVTVILRCWDDGFDTIRQYDLTPNPKAKPNPRRSDEFPCILPMQYTRVMSVAPSCCHLRTGLNGKGFWIQTQNITSRRSVYPARCLMGFDIMNPKTAKGILEEKKNKVQAASYQEDGNGLHVCEKELYARRCDMSEILARKYTIVTADLEDTVGRIAIGDRHGRIEVLDFV